ncbi:MAG: N-acetylmuramoyl-L-alanine amidase [Hyphomicrobiales bacterium]|nr:N-acetylmuramoyl-L-alanine amidase [Hyphomicrobiales bacterium]
MERTRLVVDLNDSVEMDVFVLADPPRVVVDLPAVEFTFPEDTGRAGRGLISAFRYGSFLPGRARIVIDVSGPVAVDKAFVLPAIEGQPARMVLDLVKTDRASFIAAQTDSLARMRVRDAHYARKGDRGEKPKQSGDSTLPLIVLDPGHGGIDGGTTGANGTKEKAVVLEFTKVLKAKLEETGRFRVLLTREDDTFVSLAERVKIARDANAKLFVSIHADSLTDSGFRGATVYTLSEKASDAVAHALAEKENRADAQAGLVWPKVTNEVGDILTELTQRETNTFSAVFAKSLVGEFRSAIKLVKNPHRSGGFLVLRAPDVPSILIELGYLSNAHDEQMLTSEDWRERTANAVIEAIRSFFARQVAQGPQ